MMYKRTDLLTDLEAYAYDIASWRVDHIERRMKESPNDFPDFAAALKAMKDEEQHLIQKLGGDFRELEPYTSASLVYQSSLIYEVYTQAVIDGGRVLQAFINGELPIKPPYEKQEHERSASHDIEP